MTFEPDVGSLTRHQAQSEGAVSPEADEGLAGSSAAARSRTNAERRPPGEFTVAGLGMLLLGVYSLAQGAQGEHDGLVAVSAFAFAVLAVGIVWPIVSMRRVGVEVVGPRDATVGDRISLALQFTGRVSRLEVRLLDPPGEWRRTVAPGAGELVHVASKRGVFRIVRLEMRSGGPLGVFLRRRTVWVRLRVPVTVGPRPLAERYEPQALPVGAATTLSAQPFAAGGDAVRSVRPYAPGDAARLVHWPTTARTGALAIRELEPPAITGIAIVVDLRGPEEEAEIAASRAAGLARIALRAGAHVLLLTSEPSGPVVAPVSRPLEIGRRLARGGRGRAAAAAGRLADRDDRGHVTARRLVSPRTTWGWVALACAIALGSAGALAAAGTRHGWAFGAGLGVVAALLAVLALPSLPTRTTASLILALGGVIVVRHVRDPGVGLTLVAVWAAATLFALVLVDRADLDERPRLGSASPLPGLARETVASMGILAVAVLLIGSLLVPVLGHRPPPQIGAGDAPRFDLGGSGGSSLVQNDSLDTTVRPHLGNEVVMTVTASRPEFWRGETFDHWDGHAWTRTDDTYVRLPTAGGTASVVPSDGTTARGGALLSQTFHIQASVDDVLFAAAEPVDIDAGRLPVERPDGTLFTFVPFGKDSSYRVESRVPDATAATLRAAASNSVPRDILATYAQPPVTTARVRALAARVTARAPTAYDKVRALEAWMGSHTKYSLNAPVARQGRDVVDDFLFNVRQGWCEQISSSLVVMLRTLGIPAREVTGFVPGDRSELTNEWVVRANDAHAWAEVYFPGVGWQAFDPTATVPLAGDTRAPQSLWSWVGHHVLAAAGGLLVVGAAFGLGLLLLGLSRRRRVRRSRSWAARRFDDLERLGARAGRSRRPNETAPEYADALAATLGEADLVSVGAAIDADTFSRDGIGPDTRAAADAVLEGIDRKPRGS